MKKLMTLLVQGALAALPGAALAVEVGERAPSFAANSTEGLIRLADYQGKRNVILSFYYADFTPV